MWKLNNLLLNNQLVKEGNFKCNLKIIQIEMEIQYTKIYDIAKTGQRPKFITIRISFIEMRIEFIEMRNYNSDHRNTKNHKRLP